MEFLQSQTRQNLARSFAGESQARARYTVYAWKARAQGQEWIARILEETANNEAVHAEEFLECMARYGGCAGNIEINAGYPFELGDLADNLAAAMEGEASEHEKIYPGFAETARQEGFKEIARLWMQIARVEEVHDKTFRALHKQLVDKTLHNQNEPVVWRCLNCGYTYESTRPCDPCPICSKGAGWQEGPLDRKPLPEKK